MEKLSILQCTTFGLELPARSPSIEDIPDDCLELILERLDLVNHYRGWHYLIKPNSFRESPFHRHWFLKKLWVSCPSRRCHEVGMDDIRSFGEVDDIDDVRSSPEVNGIDCITSCLGVSLKLHSCWLLLADPGTGKEQKLGLNLEDGTEIPGSHSQEISLGHCPSFATDKGLLVLNIHEDVKSKKGNRHDKFIIVNPINNSMSLLPPIPFPLCNCKLGECICKAIPLELTVNMEHQGLQSSLSSSYKAYIMESKQLPRNLRRISKDPSRNFRVIVYDSMTNLWARTGVEWISRSSSTKIFPMRNGEFYVSVGHYRPRFGDSLHDILYKFQDGRLVGQVNSPYRLKQEDRYCSSHHDRDRDSYSCGCISTTVFEAEGKIFYFQQTSWIGFFAPNCISAIVWELNDRRMTRRMTWSKLLVLNPYKFEVCKQPLSKNMMFQYEGILLVIHRGDNYHIAGFDIFKKTWCKVPKIILENLGDLWKGIWPKSVGGLFQGDLFQPDISRRVWLS